MLLKNRMGEKQLDYNQPFLTVRRFSPAVASEKTEKPKANRSLPSSQPLPYYRSDLKSGPVSNPGTVPFVWEQSPGRPKYETESQTTSLEHPPIVPKLPPGRIMKIKQQAPDKVSEDSSPRSCEGGKFPLSSQSISSLVEVRAKFESPIDEIEEESSDSGDNDETYQDALDTLSRTESFFLNCSLSGLSGLDGPEIKPSGTFSTDPQTRDFMMGRFLPAAKAMVCDSPQYAYKKPTVAKEQPQQVKNVMGVNKRPPVYRSRPNIVPNYEDYRKDESEDEDDGYDEPGSLSTKVCGLLPKFCLLSPVPGMSVRTRAPMSSINRRKVGSSSASPVHETKKEGTGLATQEQRSYDRTQKISQAARSKLNQVSYQSNNQKLEGRSLYRRLQGRGIPPHQDESPQSRFYKEAEKIDCFNSEKRCADSFQELSFQQRTDWQKGSASPMVEKTLYVDSEHMVVSPPVNSASFDRKELENSIKNDVEISKVMGVEVTSLVDSLCKEIENPKIMDENVICQHKSVNACDSNLLSANLNIPSNGYLATEYQQQPKTVESKGNSSDMDLPFPLPPPLPKSPSESWLWRTLPSMSSKNSLSLYFAGNKMNFQNQALNAPSGDFKWETIVKTTRVQHQHPRITEELTTPASKT